MDTLAKLRPIEGGVVTAGNASQQNDAAAACLVVAEDKLAHENLYARMNRNDRETSEIKGLLHGIREDIGLIKAKLFKSPK